MTILPITYLGSVGWFEHLLRDDCIIDLGENYPKQTERNRCGVLTAAGRANLTVPVVAGGSRTKKTMREVRIDHSKRWNAQHWQTLRSAYGRAPYFEHYGERFGAVYCRQWEFLVDLNLELLDIAAGILKCRERVKLSERYIVAAAGDVDLRQEPIEAVCEPYIQVFADRHPFEANLSIVDLIFNEGGDIIIAR